MTTAPQLHGPSVFLQSAKVEYRRNAYAQPSEPPAKIYLTLNPSSSTGAISPMLVLTAQQARTLAAALLSVGDPDPTVVVDFSQDGSATLTEPDAAVRA